MDRQIQNIFLEKKNIQMIKLQDYIHCYENALDLDVCKKIINNSITTNFNKANVTFGDSEHRKCYTQKLDLKFDKNLFTAVGKVIKKYSEDHKNFSTGLTIEDTGYEHLIYIGQQGGEYKEHTDHGDLTPRVLTCSFILNDDYDGGEFVFFGNTYKIPPKAGSAVVFPSNFCFPHAVTPVTNGNRHAVITWIH
tara:strand:- start:1515 stop:2093 length:579 start_codon:yes stop_codon:yes gene_type:complete